EVTSIAAEDTRVTARLLARHSIRKPMISYRAPVERRGLPRVMAALDAGDVALVSDAGTPTLSDPGQALVTAAWAAGHKVVPIPGPSSVTAALSIAGYGGLGVSFAGYLPRKPGELRRFLTSIAGDRRPTVAFDSPFRIRNSLAMVADAPAERLRGSRVLMASGTDEHGTPITYEADKLGVAPREFVDRNNALIVEDLRRLGMTYDIFTRTTTRNHYRVTQNMFLKLYEKGYLVKKTQMGAFDPVSGRTLPDR